MGESVRMSEKIKNYLKLSTLSVLFVLASGCVSTQDLSAIEAKATSAMNEARNAANAASNALRVAETAKIIAEQAKAAADTASSVATEAKATAGEAASCCEENKDRVERMFEQTMRK